MQLQSSSLLQRLKPLFRENFEKFGELGAAVSVWQNGKPVVDLYGGFCDARHEKPWTADTLVLVWSATKGIGSACLLHALQEHKINLDRPLAEFWPEFAQAGKEKITLAHLDFFLMNWFVESPERRCRIIGRKTLPDRSNSISGSAYRKRKIRAWPRCTFQRLAKHPNRSSFTPISLRPARWRARHSRPLTD